jgi:hypothetical protein
MNDFSGSLRPGQFHRSSGFEQALEAAQNSGPTLANIRIYLVVRLKIFMRSGEAHSATLWPGALAERRDLKGHPRRGFVCVYLFKGEMQLSGRIAQ